MYTLDANIFARDADPADPLHVICRDLLQVLDQQQVQIVVPNLVLAEVAATISRTRRDPIRGRLTAQALAAFEHIQLISLDDALAQEAAELAIACFWVKRADVTALVPVTLGASEAQVPLDGRPIMLLGIDVVDLVREEGVVLVQPAVLAAATSPLGDQAPQSLWHVGHAPAASFSRARILRRRTKCSSCR